MTTVLPPAFVRRAKRERVGLLIQQLSDRCDREGLDVVIARHADSHGAMYSITVTNWRDPANFVHSHAADMADALDQTLDNLNRKALQ